VIGFFLVVEMTNTGRISGVSIPLGPINRLVLGLERAERMIRVVFNDVISNGTSFGSRFS
jgi:hypothetical protein